MVLLKNPVFEVKYFWYVVFFFDGVEMTAVFLIPLIASFPMDVS
jgi:hypothetical protein